MSTGEVAELEPADVTVPASCLPEGTSWAFIEGAGPGDWMSVTAKRTGPSVHLQVVGYGCHDALETTRPIPHPFVPDWLHHLGIDAAALKFRPEPDAEPATVNLYAVAGGGLVKIGRTAGTVANRVAAMQGSSPVPLEIVATSVERPGRTEADLHAEFAACRRHGEWFDLSAFTATGQTVAQVLGFEEAE